MKPRVLAILTVIALHPLLLIGNLDWPSLVGVNPVSLQSGAIFGAIELVVLASLAQRLGWRPSVVAREIPPAVEVTPSGFVVALPGPVPSKVYGVQAALGVVASVVGFLVLTVLVAILPYLGEPITSTGSFVAATVGAYAVLQTLVMIAVARARYQQQKPVSIELQGRILRVDGKSLALDGHSTFARSTEHLTVSDGSTVLMLRGPADTLSWVERHLRAVEDGGTRDDVPDALGRVSRKADRHQ